MRAWRIPGLALIPVGLSCACATSRPAGVEDLAAALRASVARGDEASSIRLLHTLGDRGQDAVEALPTLADLIDLEGRTEQLSPPVFLELIHALCRVAPHAAPEAQAHVLELAEVQIFELDCSAGGSEYSTLSLILYSRVAGEPPWDVQHLLTQASRMSPGGMPDCIALLRRLDDAWARDALPPDARQ